MTKRVQSSLSMKPRLRFCLKELVNLSLRYSYQSNESDLSHLKSGINSRGFLTKDDLRKVARWKSPRRSGLIERNSEEFVQEITRAALTSANERTRIEVLTLLDGVQWPTASVILHFFHRDQYPIVDFRALWSLSLDVPKPYTFAFWLMYVDCCRDLAKQAKLSMREVDQALWQYSKENQATK